MGDVFGWRLFDLLWWVVDTISSKCINRGFLTVDFDLLYWSSVFDHLIFLTYVRKIIIFSVCGPFYWILHNLMIISFLSLKFDWNFFCCCSKVTEKLTIELATETHLQLRAIGVLVIAFSVGVENSSVHECGCLLFLFFFLFFSVFPKMFSLTVTRRKVS
jgi:hypothetical protein